MVIFHSYGSLPEGIPILDGCITMAGGYPHKLRLWQLRRALPALRCSELQGLRKPLCCFESKKMRKCENVWRYGNGWILSRNFHQQKYLGKLYEFTNLNLKAIWG